MSSVSPSVNGTANAYNEPLLGQDVGDSQESRTVKRAAVSFLQIGELFPVIRFDTATVQRGLTSQEVAQTGLRRKRRLLFIDWKYIFDDFQQWLIRPN
jgi:hypothetical protein